MRSSPAIVRLALALVLCVVAGVLLAGVAFPLIGGVGLATKQVADQFDPEKPPALVLPQRSKILDADGHVIATLFTQNRVTVKLSQIPKYTQDALIAIEDDRFYDHGAIDPKGTLRALVRNSSSGTVQQGGSTLTQQYVKNLLILSASSEAEQKAAISRTTKRKLQEARYAIYLEQHMTKPQILQGYFNIAYYDSGVYGVGTAASHYFSKRIQDIDLAQGALLAGMVQNPSKYDPAVHPDEAVKRRNVVLGRMLELGYISQAQHDHAVREGVGVHLTEVKSGCEAPGVRAPFFCDYVRRYLEDTPAGAGLGDTVSARQDRLLQGGLTIQTTLDPTVQAAAQKAVDDQVPSTDPSGVAAVSDSVDPSTGEIRAMAVDRPFGEGKGQTKVNLAIGGSLGFQGGSTFKAFVLATALQQGIPPTTTYYAPTSFCSAAIGYTTAGGKKCPGNAGDSESGTYDMVQATWRSVNTWFLQLEVKTGISQPVQLAQDLGIQNLNNGEPGPIPHFGSFVLGTAGGFSPLAMAGAYGAFAAQGTFCPPHPVSAITDSNGRAIPIPADQIACKQAMTPAVANGVTSILRGVINGPDPLRTGASASIGRPAAGKTGTTNGSQAAWFIGYTPQLATAVWVGKPIPAPLVDITINHQRYSQVYGGTIPAAIWKETMLAALAGDPVEDFPNAPAATSIASLKTVPDVTQQPLALAESMLTAAGFSFTVGPAIPAAPTPASAVAQQSPAGGAHVPSGSTITLIPSNGLAAPPSPGATASSPPSASPAPPAPPTHKPTSAPTAAGNPTPSKEP